MLYYVFNEKLQKGCSMRRRWQAWQYLIGIFAAFWVLFATILIVSELPFYVITIALSTTGMLSLLIIALAWAYQNNY
jgi:hypothetical protein